MALPDALTALGINRVVWIDDLFASRPPEIAEAVLHNPDAARQIDEFREIIEGASFDPEGARQRLEQAIADLDHDRREAVFAKFLSSEAEQSRSETPELSPNVVHQACNALNVALEDRWSFDEAPERIQALMAEGDQNIVYILDLNESGGSDFRGLEMIRLLWNGGSSGIPFILTHYAEVEAEAEKEAELRERIAEDGDDSFGVPVSVISKGRLPVEKPDDMQIEGVFEIGLKRAGLRRAVYAVLKHAQGQISKAFDEAAGSLLRVAPEQLESYVIERGHAEGVSEMHVIERALTAQVSQSLRRFFGSNAAVLESVRMLRAFRTIALASPVGGLSSELAEFRKAEVWDSEAVVNGSYSPIACGDVFELDTAEDATRNAQRKFVLLGQPCDIAIRGDGTRIQGAGFLVPIIIAPEGIQGTQKAPLLPFTMDGRRWRYDFRQACVVKLSILDLASFRTDGRVRVDSGHEPAADLLPGQLTIYPARVAFADKVLAGEHQHIEAPLINEELALMFGDARVFKHVRVGAFKAGVRRQGSGKKVALPDRVTWHLRRIGRIRMPYAAWLLEQLLADMSRQAFDMEF